MNKPKMTQTVRIIAGDLRRRKIVFPDIPCLRPTQDRIRETLFNWLQPVIEDSRCLDLFAGSGALGFEALSRGASHVTFVDSDRLAVTALGDNVKLFSLTNASIQCLRIPDASLISLVGTYDIVFLDPPFGQGLMLPTFQWLIQQPFFSSDTVVYFEIENQAKKEFFSSVDLRVFKDKSTKLLSYGLFKVV